MAEPETIEEIAEAADLRDGPDMLPAGLLEDVIAALESRDSDGLRDLVVDLHEADLGELVQTLKPEHRALLVVLLGPAFDFSALTELDDAVRKQLLEALPTELVGEGLRELDSDDAIYILEDLDGEHRAAILEHLPLPDRAALTRGLDFPEESAGRLMQTDFVALPPFWTVGRAIDYLREAGEVPDSFYEIFVINPAFRLLGSVQLGQLLRAKRQQRLESLLDEDPRRVHATDDREDVARLFQRYNLLSAAVVDEHERLVGMLTVDDIVDVIQEETEEDLRALGGVFGGEEISTSIAQTARSRFPWLVINLGTAFCAAAVIALFEGTIEQMVALAVLMPIVASLGGNTGTQAMTVTVRALATRELTRRNTRRIVLREALVGFGNGVLIALLLGAVAALWFASIELGAVIAAALVTTMLAAGLFGTLVPIALDKLGFDPAVASAVFLTTTTDVVAFFTFLGLAAWWFGLW
jgi:magnesium transporter